MKDTGNILSQRFYSCENDGTGSEQTVRALVDALEAELILQQSYLNCPFCENEEADLISEKDRLGIPCNTVMCRQCGSVFNDSYFSKEGAKIFYENYWKDIQWKGDAVRNFQKRTSPQAFCWRRYAYIEKHLGENFTSIKRVADIGCGDGCNIVPFYDKGFQVFGCDFDDDCLAVGRNYGLTLFKGDSSVLIDQKIKADLIILSHVVEHWIDLDKEIENVRSLLNEKGFLYVEVPGLLNWVRPDSQRLRQDGYSSGNDLLAYLQCMHNYHFHLDNLKYFFEKNGFLFCGGDEWVRAIFQKTEKESSASPYSGRFYQKTLSHLQKTEQDYQSFFNRVLRNLKKLKVLMK